MTSLIEEEEKLWNSWSAGHAPVWTLDEKPVQDVFAAIKKQLDILRRRQHQFQDDLDYFHEDFNSKLILQQASSHHSSSTGHSSQPVGGAASSHELQDLRGEIQKLRDEVHSLRDTESKLKTLEVLVHSHSKEQDKRIDQLVMALNEQRVEHANLQQQLFNFEQSMRSELAKIQKDYEEKITNVEINQMMHTKDTDLKFSQVRDTLSVQDLRTKQFESRIHRSADDILDLQETLKSIQNKDLESIHNSINELYTDKANKADLDGKADLMLLTEKADIGDILRLQGLAEEVERRVLHVTQETSDRFQGMDAKLDRRSDRIVTWCLKQLRKEMKALANGGRDDEGKDDTDIGRIRCLVCNHVSTQQRDTDIVHSGPGITTTLKLHQRNGRSPSPPRSPETPHHHPATATPATTAGTGYHAAMAAATAQHSNAAHSRLVKMASSPEVQYGREGTVEDPDFIADFKYRAGANSNNNRPGTAGTTSMMPTPVVLPHTGPQQSQSTPLIQIISHHPTDQTHVRLTQLPFHQQQQQQDVLNYYKDMESKLIPKSSNGPSNNSKPSDKHRPGSAPIKRSNTTSKLQPMGKVM